MARRLFLVSCMALLQISFLTKADVREISGGGIDVVAKSGNEIILQPVNTSEQPAVVEFFSFYCPPCFAFSQQYGIDKGIRDVLPSGKKMVKYHVDFLGPLGPQLTDAWAMAQVMGIQDKVEPLLFEATQVNRSLTTPDSIRAVFEKAGVSGEEYDRMMDSILVKARAAEMRQLFRDYKVTGTPAVFVNGQHINNSDCHGETPEAYRREYVDTVENLLKAGG